MEATAIAALASNNALAQVQQEASVEVLRKALDLQGESAMQLLQAIPRPPRCGGRQHGGRHRRHLGLKAGRSTAMISSTPWA